VLFRPIPAPPAPTIDEAMQRVRTYGNTDLAALGLIGTPPGTSLPTRGTAALMPVATGGKAGFHDSSPYFVGLFTNSRQRGRREGLLLAG